MLGDRRIEQLIAEALDADSRIDAGEVSVGVQDRVVYLSGAVDSAAERRAVEEDVRAVADVESVVDELSLRNFVERTDDELAESVRRALLRDIAVDAACISVATAAGVVTLGGRVSSYCQRLVAENITWWTAGVTDVIGHIEVDGTTGPLDEPDY